MEEKIQREEVLQKLYTFQQRGYEVPFSHDMSYRQLFHIYYKIEDEIQREKEYEKEYKFERSILVVFIEFLKIGKIINTATALELFKLSNKEITDILLNLINKEEIFITNLYENLTFEQRQYFEEFLKYFNP